MLFQQGRLFLKRYRAALLLILGGGILLYHLFGDVLLKPNRYAFNLGGDGLKNYFSTAYHVRYGGGFWFDGMHYPFGDHLVYTDAQPALAWTLRFFQEAGFHVDNQVVGISNALMILSLILAWVLLYRIGRYYGLSDIWAAATALLTGLLSPQLLRMPGGHYALAYVCFVPWVWWLFTKMEPASKLRWLWALLLLISLVIGGWLHPYYLLLGSGFAGAFGLVKGIFSKENRWFWIGFGLAWLVLPLILFQGTMMLTDPVTDRPSNPFGFFLFRATWYTLALPWHGTWYDMWQFGIWQNWIVSTPDFETWVFLGWTTVWAVLLLGFRLGKNIWKKRRLPRLRQLAWAILPAVLVLFFAMAWPFVWFGDEPPEWLGPLRQFRSLGRFAWVFYYVISIAAARYFYGLYRLIQIKSGQGIARGIVLAIFALWSFQAYEFSCSQLRQLRHTLGQNVLRPGDLDWGRVLSDAGQDPAQFQAAITFPTFFIGSEKFIDRYTDGEIQKMGFKLTYDTGIPLVCNSTSRTSVGQTSQLRQLFADGRIRRDILAKFDPQKPLLVLSTDDAVMDPAERLIFEKSERIASWGRFILYKLPIAAFQDHVADTWQQFEAQKDSLTEKNGFLVSDTSTFIFNGFDTRASAFGQETKANTDLGENIELFAGPTPVVGPHEVSCWVRINPRTHGMPIFNWAAYTLGGVLRQEEHATRFSYDVMGDWVRFSALIDIPGETGIVSFWITGREAEVESFLLRKPDQDIWQLRGDTLFYNNYYLPSRQ